MSLWKCGSVRHVDHIFGIITSLSGTNELKRVYLHAHDIYICVSSPALSIIHQSCYISNVLKQKICTYQNETVLLFCLRNSVFFLKLHDVHVFHCDTINSGIRFELRNMYRTTAFHVRLPSFNMSAHPGAYSGNLKFMLCLSNGTTQLGNPSLCHTKLCRECKETILGVMWVSGKGKYR